jgi:type I restriction enzyme, S subunit
MSGWPFVPLAWIIKPIERAEVPVTGNSYRQVGVKLWGVGAYEREAIDGGGTRYKTLSRVEANDIIVNKIWARNGSVAVVPANLAGCYVSGEFPTFTPIPDKLDPRWFHWITKTRFFWDQCDAKSRGTSGKNRIRPERFLEIEIPLPPLPEQRRIVAWIEELAAKINEARGLRQKAAREAETLMTSQLRAAYSLERKQYGSTRLEQLITEAGYGTSEKCSPERDEGSVPVLRIPNVASERINLDDLKFAPLSVRDRQRLYLTKGDILIVRTNGSRDLVGRSAVVDDLPEPMAFASYMIRLRFDSSTVMPTYAQRMLRHLRISGQLFDFARTTAGQYNVSLGRLQAAEIPLPPLAQQHHIVLGLDAVQAQVDALKKFQAQTAAETEALLPSILDRAFNGKF